MKIENKFFWGILGIIVITLFVFSVILIYEGEEYKSQYVSCVNNYNNLVGNYNLVLQAYNYTENTQVLEYNDIVDKYNSLADKYNIILKDYESIKTNYLIPPYIQVLNRTIVLKFQFENDTSTQTWSWPIEDLETSFFKGKIMREKDIDEMDLYIPNLSNKFKDYSRYNFINEQMAIELRPYIETEYFEEFGKYIYNKFSTDEERIGAVWYIITNLIRYTPEIKETPRLPLETLLGAGGDCKDSSILIASILKSMNSEWNVSLVYIDTNNLEDPKDLNHVIVYIDTGNYSTYIETISNEIINPYYEKEINGFYFEIK